MNVCIDLSHNNSTVNLHSLKAQGILYAILKCNQGSFADPACRDLAARVREVDMHLGIYSFLNDGDPDQQMADMLGDAAGLGAVTVDLDFEESAKNQATGAILEGCVVYLVSKVGRHPRIYSDQ